MTAVWAHRGAGKGAPENTLEAFDLARTLGADGVELDVQRTSDGRLVVIHDETIDRTSTGRGLVGTQTLAELRAFSFDDGREGFGHVVLPELADVFDLLRDTGMTINVELKDGEVPYPGMGAQVDALVESFGLVDRVVYSSFNHYTLRELRDAGTRVRLGLLLAEALIEPWQYAAGFGAAAIHPSWPTVLMPGYVESSHDAGVPVHAWTVDGEHALHALVRLGVDAVITNDPELALRVRG